MIGYIKLYRKMKDWEWFDDPNVLVIWVHLLLDANWEDDEWRGQTIRRGSLYTSLPRLASESGLTLKQVRLALDKLEKGSQIVRERADKGQVITICKYEDYQASEDEEGQAKGTQQGSSRVPYLRREEEIYNNISLQNAGACAHTRENWRFLTSARKFSLGNNPDAIADYKKELIAEELSLVAAEIKMPQDAQEKFLAKWCEHNPGSDKIKADYEATFNIRDRAIQFMGWWKRNDGRQSATQQPKSRSDKFDEEMNKIDAFFDGFYGNKQQPSGVDEQ